MSFDDGFRNNLTVAAPELQRLGIPALIHVATGYIGTDRILWPLELDRIILDWPYPALPMPHGRPAIDLPAPGVERRIVCERVRTICKEIPDESRCEFLQHLRDRSSVARQAFDAEVVDFLSWDEVRRLRQMDFAIGSHSVEHAVLSRLTGERLEEELGESKKKIQEEVGAECRWIAYPNGGASDFSPQVISACQRAGYQLGFTAMRGFNSRTTPPFELFRVGCTAEVSHAEFEAVVSGVHACLKRFV